MAHFEVYILNYNGNHFLQDCLSSLREMDRGPHRVEINVVDNCSDESPEALLREKFPEVNFIRLEDNYGFSKGNNLGIKIRTRQLEIEGSKADYCVLLNNDTKVDRNWLLAAYEVFAEHPDVGIVGSKAIFADRFAEISIRTRNPYNPSSFGLPDDRYLGPSLHIDYSGSNLESGPGRAKILNAYPSDGFGRLLQPNASFFAPIKNPNSPAWIGLYFENKHPGREPLELEVQIVGEAKLHFFEVHAIHPEPAILQLKPEFYRAHTQNAGCFVNDHWQSGDRGFLDPDDESYTEKELVPSICGVSMFVRTEVWDKLKGFDEKYFAYYEDTDLSMRAQMLGVQCMYTPHSRLYHVHCGSGIEYSDYFLNNVYWSWLIFSSKTMNRKKWRAQLAEYRKRGKAELIEFQNDHRIGNKATLQAYCRYLKNFHYFTRNRIDYYRKRPDKHLQPYITHA